MALLKGMEYHFYPPFFEVAPETSFDEAWESFCCLVLKLEHKTTDIRRRVPPDYGVDLYWQAGKIAYQCKAVISGRTVDFSVAKAIDSIQRAKEKQTVIGWEHYVICTNVEITGSQEEKIRMVLPGVSFLTTGYWSLACRRHEPFVENRFRRLIRVGDTALTASMNKSFYRKYADKLARKLREKTIMLLVYSNKRREVYEVPASPLMSVKDFLNVLISLFNLPGKHRHTRSGITMALSYSLKVNNRAVDLDKKLGSVVKDRDTVTLWKTITWKDDRGESQEKVVEFLKSYKSGVASLPVQERKRIAISEYEQRIQESFDKTLMRIEAAEPI